MKGIILAGGYGSRLFPITKSISKQLLPVFDKPMVYYPLSILMLAGIREVLIITTSRDIENFKLLFKNSDNLGLNLSFAIQERPEGLAQAFIIGEKFIGNDNIVLILGDNMFYGSNFPNLLREALKDPFGATLFGFAVRDAKAFGVLEINENNEVISLEEKPDNPKSHFAVTGLYIYDNQVVQFAKAIKPSERGELEITSINNLYLAQKTLKAQLLGRGYSWFDMGNHKSLLEASNFVETIEKRQGYKIACIEEIAWRNKWISKRDLLEISKLYPNKYGEYLREITE